VIVQTERRAPSTPDFDALEREIGEAVRTWQDRLREALLAVLPEDRALAVLARFGDRFSAAYQEEVPADRAVEDIPRVAGIADGERRLERRLDDGDARTWLASSAFSASRPIPLHVALRILENMGLTVLGERIYTVKPEGSQIWIQIYSVETAGGRPVEAGAIAARFEECFAHVLAGDIDDDGFNAFVVTAGLGWRDVALLRAYGKYLAQTGLPFSQPYVQEVLARYPAFCEALVGLFHATFDPDRDRAEKTAARERDERALAAELERTSTLDEDRILRAFVGAVRGTLRTNFFQRGSGGEPKPYISFKLDPSKLPELPEPRPMFEIYVYSQRVEGVHLRA